jgi:hypothetical protein
MSGDPDVERACKIIDEAMFSDDVFMDRNERKNLREFMLKWEQKMKEFDAADPLRKRGAAYKVANNILDFLIDPTKIPVRQHIYFRPEENLQNDILDKTRADVYKAYGDQRYNTDFYPSKNRLRNLERQAFLMDRKSLIASFDILSQNFKKKDDPFSVQLRTMALAVSKMKDEELDARLAGEEAPDLEGTLVEAKEEMFDCPNGCKKKDGKPMRVMMKMKYCLKCKKHVEPPKTADEAEKDAMLNPGHPSEIGQRFQPSSATPGGPKIQSVYEEHEEEIKKTPWALKFFKDLGVRTASETEEDNWTEDCSAVLASYLVQDVLGMEMEPGNAEPEPVKEEVAPKKEDAPKVAPAKEEKKDVVPPPAPVKEEEKKTAAVKKEEEKEPVKEEKEAAKKEEEKKPVEEVKPEKDKEAAAKKDEPKKADTVVNTDVLATFGGIEIPQGIIDVESLSADEESRLAQLF